MSGVDFTGYAGLFGESLSSRVKFLDNLIGSAHYPSVGQYKEKLLANAIREYLPRTVEVGTGFVMFPHAETNPTLDPDTYDPLNQSAYSVSRQCDILVYDTTKYPVIFRDDNFVIVRPQAVRAVIEVKGNLSRTDLLKTLWSFHDFGMKWRNTQLFYLESGVSVTPAPALFVLAWNVRRAKTGRWEITPSAVRNTIANFYVQNVPLSIIDGFPLLEQFLIYNETQITHTFQYERVGEDLIFHLLWSSRNGKYVRRSPDGSFRQEGDRTITALLAALRWTIVRPNTKDFDRFMEYHEEVRDPNAYPYKYAGESRAWSNMNGEETRRITGRIPVFALGSGSDA
jgi:hypothetical protein